MDEETFNAKLQELIRKIANLPSAKQKQLGALVEETKKQHGAIKAKVDKITKSLGDLRICIQYLLFDLEATRRERDQLKNQPPKNEDDDQPNKAEGEM